MLSTHSNVMLNHLVEHDALVYELASAGGSVDDVREVAAGDLIALFDDLGVRASQILQTNAVIWVEGPSDEIYLPKWISIWSGDQIVYGRDYVTVAYGGSQLRRLGAFGYDAGRLATLSRIARHSIIVMDRDTDGPDDAVDEVKDPRTLPARSPHRVRPACGPRR